MSDGNVPELRAFDNAPEDEATPQEVPVSEAAPSVQHADLPALKLWRGGYQFLVPIVPPDAELSERSVLFKRPQARGKVPGEPGFDGRWRSIKDWQTSRPTVDDLVRWSLAGAGFGIRTGEQADGTFAFAIDADTKDPAAAAAIEAAVSERFGVVPTRIGNAPKALYLIRCSGPFPYTQLAFKGGVVEVLGEAKQFVAVGIHPATRKGYHWSSPIHRLDALQVRSPEEITALLDELRAALPEAGDVYTEGGGSRANTPQRQLVGNAEVLKRAISLIPNVYKAPGRADFVKMAATFRGAFQDHYELGLELFCEWADKADLSGRPDDDVHEDPEQVYRSIKAPFGRGAPHLYKLAEAADPTGAFTKAGAIAATHFDAEAVAVQPATPAPTDVREMVAPVDWFSPSSWEGQVIKPRESEVENWIPRRQVTLLYGDGGIGKTLLAQQLATSMAAGLPWLGQVTRPGRVLCVFCEDDPDELQRRQGDINRALGITHADLANMLITSRTHEDNALATWGRDGRMELRPFWQQICDQALAFRADLIILDTLSDIFIGSEIDRAQVTAFVKGCLGRLAHAIGGSVLALAHPSQAGKSSGQGTSGSSAWNNAVRSRLYLSALDGNARELVNMKLNYGPKGSKLKLEWCRGAFRVTSGAMPANVQTGPGSIPMIDDAAEAAVAQALIACRGEQMHPGTTSKFNATKLFRTQVPETLTGFTDPEVTAALSRMMGRGDVQSATLARDSHGRPRPTLVLVDKMSPTAAVAEERDSSSE